MSDWKISTKVKVRFRDCDMMGHVNNAVFFSYFEEARVAYFKNILELDFTKLENEAGKSVILASIQADFLTPAYLGETLLIKIKTEALKRSSFVFAYEIVEEASQRLIATSKSTQVYYDYTAKKSIALDEVLRKKFEVLEGKSFT